MPVQYFSFGGLVNCLSAALLGLFVFSRQPHDIRHQTYAIFCFCLTVWSYGYFRWLMSDNAADALLWSRVLMAGAIFIPPTAFHHLVRLLDKKISHVFIAGNYVMSMALFCGNWDNWIVTGAARAVRVVAGPRAPVSSAPRAARRPRAARARHPAAGAAARRRPQAQPDPLLDRRRDRRLERRRDQLPAVVRHSHSSVRQHSRLGLHGDLRLRDGSLPAPRHRACH